MQQIDVIKRYVDQYPDHLELARTAADIERIQKDKKVASMIGNILDKYRND